MNSCAETRDAMTDEKTEELPKELVINRLVDGLVSKFLRLTIAKKLLLGFSSLLALLIVISAYALTNLNRLNSINDSILLTDLPVILAADEMVDLIFSEELYSRRYAVFRTDEVMGLFKDRNAEFESQLERIRSVPEERDFPVDQIAALHEDYVALLLDASGSTTEASTTFSAVYDQQIKARQDELIAVIRDMGAQAQRDQNEKTNTTASIGSLAFKAAAILCGLGLLLSLLAAALITNNISGAINKLRAATELIARGEFDIKPDISNTDELGDLADAFVSMAERLKHLEETNLDTSPLTRLPGGTTIETVMKKRIADEEEIAFCLMDIDNFKAYNDHYGYARGNELIQATADIVSQAVAEHGGEADFIGHIGGDDFVVITAPDSFEAICQHVVDAFDAAVPDFYNASDRKRGYIVGENRQGDEVQFPLATISIAVVTNKSNQALNHIQFGEMAAEMKEHAKAKPGSVFMVERRAARDGSKEDRKPKAVKA
ncbi:MAG: diguanylate cyclase [Halieaceae bacterium]|jgi:diguanylate cyclase (GGDEF)-like protein|nr:diguanylate cyclase [Halieaceae bacterium]